MKSYQHPLNKHNILFYIALKSSNPKQNLFVYHQSPINRFRMFRPLPAKSCAVQMSAAGDGEVITQSVWQSAQAEKLDTGESCQEMP
jgi:hypothetical protein